MKTFSVQFRYQDRSAGTVESTVSVDASNLPGAVAKATREFVKKLDRKQRFDMNKSGLRLRPSRRKGSRRSRQKLLRVRGNPLGKSRRGILRLRGGASQRTGRIEMRRHSAQNDNWSVVHVDSRMLRRAWHPAGADASAAFCAATEGADDSERNSWAKKAEAASPARRFGDEAPAWSDAACLYSVATSAGDAVAVYADRVPVWPDDGDVRRDDVGVRRRIHARVAGRFGRWRIASSLRTLAIVAG